MFERRKKQLSNAKKNAINLRVYSFLQLAYETSLIHWQFQWDMEKYFSPFSSFSRNTNMCMVTGKGRSVYKAFRMTRNVIHDKGTMGLLNGLAKSSW